MNTLALIFAATLAADPVAYAMPPTGRQAYATARAAAADGSLVILQVIDDLTQERKTQPAIVPLDLSTWPPDNVRQWLERTPRPYLLLLAPGGPTGVLSATSPPALLTSAQTRHRKR